LNSKVASPHGRGVEVSEMKILIVDDSMAMRRIVRRTLRQAGFGGHDCVEAENGKLALESVAAEKPDLVLCDWNMPEMNGIEFLRALRASGDATPFGFITTEGTEDMRATAKEAGAAFLLAKPFTPDDMAREAGAFLG
jgi:two-component system chemotaxis response regulator CheY